MKTRTLYTEYVGSNPKDKKDIDYARVFARDRQRGKKNKMGLITWYAVSIQIPAFSDKSDKWITDWYEVEDACLKAKGL